MEAAPGMLKKNKNLLSALCHLWRRTRSVAAAAPATHLAAGSVRPAQVGSGARVEGLHEKEGTAGSRRASFAAVPWRGIALYRHGAEAGGRLLAGAALRGMA